MIAFAICSCNQTSPIKKEAVKEETPEALQDGYSISKVSRSYSNIMEELYQELMEKDEALKKLDEEIEMQRSKEEDLQKLVEGFNSKSSNYYNAASGGISTIKDQDLQRRMLAMVAQHQNLYNANFKNLENWTDVISKKRVSISDHYTAMKIALTLEVMASYQKNQKPEVKEFQTFAKQEDSLISVVKKKIK
jgi:hypothetical protein